MDQIDLGTEEGQHEANQRRFAAWWIRQSDQALAMCMQKAREYGSRDLELIGYALGQAAGIPAERLQERPEILTQLGIAFYLQGKVARVLDALARGEDPSLDSWTDAMVYAKMGLRAREKGAWPALGADPEYTS